MLLSLFFLHNVHGAGTSSLACATVLSWLFLYSLTASDGISAIYNLYGDAMYYLSLTVDLELTKCTNSKVLMYFRSNI